MAFTAKYSDLATLAQSSVFQARVTGAVVNYANFIIGEGSGVTNHEHRIAWAKLAIFNPAQYAAQLYWASSVDPAFSGLATSPIDPAATNVSDATLDTVVQTAINNTILKF